jgi:hypothetical protein
MSIHAAAGDRIYLRKNRVLAVATHVNGKKMADANNASQRG